MKKRKSIFTLNKETIVVLTDKKVLSKLRGGQVLPTTVNSGETTTNSTENTVLTKD